MHIMGWVKCQHRVGESGVIPNIFSGENISRIHWWIKAKSFKQCFLFFRNFCSQRLWCWQGNSQVTSTFQIHFCQGIAIFWGVFPLFFGVFLVGNHICSCQAAFQLEYSCWISLKFFLVLCQSNITDSNSFKDLKREKTYSKSTQEWQF